MKHLTQQQIGELTAKLTRRTGWLAARVREELAESDEQHYRDLAGTVTDTADEALAHTLVDVGTEIIDRHIVELRDIDAAQQRIRQQSYGDCVDCGEAIVFERLSVYPTAKRCLVCQQRHEHDHPRAGRPGK